MIAEREGARELLVEYGYRCVAGLASLVLALGPLRASRHGAVALAVLLLGSLILVHACLDFLWSRLVAGVATRAPASGAPASGTPGGGAPGGRLAGGGAGGVVPALHVAYTKGFQQAAGAFLGLPGLLLGLLGVFGKPPLPLALKLAAAALVVSLLLSALLLSFSAFDVPPRRGAVRFLGCLANVILWSLALGLFCIMAAVDV